MAHTTSLDSLSIELLTHIFEFVVDSSPDTAKSIAAINHYSRSASKLVIHRYKEVYFSYDHGSANTSLQQWLDDSDILQGLRYLTVGGSLYQDDSNNDNVDVETLNDVEYKWSALTRLIERLGNLKALTWQYPGHVPLSIIRTLEKHQRSAELKVFDWQRNKATADHNDEDELALANSPALTAITANIWTRGSEVHPDLREAAFRRVVACAPNLKSASISKGHSGCVIYGRTGSHREQLRELEANFSSHQKVSNSLRTLSLDGCYLSEYTLRDWSRVANLSKLQRLECSRGSVDPSFFPCAPAMLLDLKHVKMNLLFQDRERMKPAAEAWLVSCSPLQSLGLSSGFEMVPLATILDRHGPTITSLHLHKEESVDRNQQKLRRELNLDDIRKIEQLCPNLRDLTMDLNRRSQELNTNDHIGIFQALAKVGLQKLQIYYDVGISAFNRFRRENLNVEHLSPSEHKHIEPHVKMIWETVFGNMQTGERALDVKFGEWERNMGAGYPEDWLMIEQEQKTYWQVRPAERDDRHGSCTVRRFGGFSDRPRSKVSTHPESSGRKAFRLDVGHLSCR